ncbi:MAG: diguanylate cyclase [Chloroflexi bacterium]|nr:MAG: diguanylate cyclase [Chloroflexota bacterium]
MSERVPRAAAVLIAATMILAVPFLASGTAQATNGTAPSIVPFFIYALAVLLSIRPIRIAPTIELSASEVAVLAGVVLLPPGTLALVTALARLTNDIAQRKSPIRIVRNVGAAAISAGSAAMAYQIVGGVPTERIIGAPAELIIAGVVAAVVLVTLDLAQIVALQFALGRETASRPTWSWVARTARAQILWGLAAVITVEVVVIEPWFLVPGIPLFLLGYIDIRARFAAERRARLLETLVEVGRSVGGAVDPTDVFRGVYRSVTSVMDADAFYVATLGRDPEQLRYRFLVDDRRELEPVERVKSGTLAGACIERKRPLLLRDTERDRRALGLTDRSAWGTVQEKSIIVAPLRLRGAVIGAISAQSARASAYDDSDLDLLVAIATEAAVAIDRADLYDRTATLSRRLRDLHRIGLELSAQSELNALVAKIAHEVESTLGATAAAVYLDKGGDELEFAATTGQSAPDLMRLPKGSATIAAVLGGRAVEYSEPSVMPESTRTALERFDRKAVLVQPLRAGDESIGVLFVTWQEPHALTDEERELVGILAGIGASAIHGIRLYRELDEAYLSTVSTLTAMIQARDQYREDHQRRLAADAVALGERLGFAEDQMRDLRYASLFQSLGKIGIPAAIVAKTGKLTPEEREIVQEHPVLGARILETIRFLRPVVPLVRAAYENHDGSGYPERLAGEAIPLAARILRVVISYHAMLSDRPYRGQMRPEHARAELRRYAGTRYDPRVVEEFVTLLEARGAVAAVEEEMGAGRELAILAELTPEFHAILDLEQLLRRILGIIERHMPGASLTIMLRDERTDELMVRAVAGAWTSVESPSRLGAGRGISGWVLASKEPQLVEDVRADPRYVGDPAVRSELVVPLVSGGRAIGVLVLSHRSVGAFGQRDLTLMQAVGAQIAAAIDVADMHERLKKAANTDALTGIHNYRYFYDRLEEEVARAERRGAPLTLAFFDIDDLKVVNDTYGHLVGNEVLRTLGQTISKHVRLEDVPARYGGDEFAIVMPDTPREEAEKVVARLMEEIDEIEIALPAGGTIKMPSRSWGVAAYPRDGRTAEALVENADTRAYAHKRSR